MPPTCKLCTARARVTFTDGPGGPPHALCHEHARIVYRRHYGRDIDHALRYGSTFALPQLAQPSPRAS